MPATASGLGCGAALQLAAAPNVADALLCARLRQMARQQEAGIDSPGNRQQRRAGGVHREVDRALWWQNRRHHDAEGGLPEALQGIRPTGGCWRIRCGELPSTRAAAGVPAPLRPRGPRAVPWVQQGFAARAHTPDPRLGQALLLEGVQAERQPDRVPDVQESRVLVGHSGARMPQSEAAF